MQAEGLKVQDVVVLIDREQGGAARMATNGLKLHAAFPITFLLDVLVRWRTAQHGLSAACCRCRPIRASMPADASTIWGVSCNKQLQVLPASLHLNSASVRMCLNAQHVESAC